VQNWTVRAAWQCAYLDRGRHAHCMRCATQVPLEAQPCCSLAAPAPLPPAVQGHRRSTEGEMVEEEADEEAKSQASESSHHNLLEVRARGTCE